MPVSRHLASPTGTCPLHDDFARALGTAVAFSSPGDTETPAVRRINPEEMRRDEMDEESFRRKLGEILGALEASGRAPNPAETSDPLWSEELRDSVAKLHGAVDHLRLRVKYLVFDLEATRRENAYLRAMLDRAVREDRRRKDADEDRGRGDA